MQIEWPTQSTCTTFIEWVKLKHIIVVEGLGTYYYSVRKIFLTIQSVDYDKFKGRHMIFCIKFQAE